MKHRTLVSQIAVSPEGWFPLSAGWEVSVLSVIDTAQSLPSGDPLFARSTYTDALAWCKANGYELLSVADVWRLRDIGLELTPYLGTPIAENALRHSVLHDANIRKQLLELGWDHECPVFGDGKYWISGARDGSSRLMGWDVDGSGPGDKLWQPPQNAHNRHHHDDGTTFHVKRAA